MNQNKPSSTTAAASEAIKTHIPARELTPLPSFLKYLGLSSTEEVPGFIPPVFSVDNPRVCRPEGWKPEATPAFLEGMNLVRKISKVRMFVSSNPYDLYVTAPGGGCAVRSPRCRAQRQIIFLKRTGRRFETLLCGPPPTWSCCWTASKWGAWYLRQSSTMRSSILS